MPNPQDPRMLMQGNGLTQNAGRAMMGRGQQLAAAEAAALGGAAPQAPAMPAPPQGRVPPQPANLWNQRTPELRMQQQRKLAELLRRQQAPVTDLPQ